MNLTEQRRSNHPTLRVYSPVVFGLLIIIMGQAGVVMAQGQWTTSGNNINSTNTGNVGVGTNAPEQKLHVNGNEILSTGPLAGFKFRDRNAQANTNNWVWYSLSSVARFHREGYGDVMGITTAGNFGIGTTNPAAKFHIIGADGPSNNSGATAPDALLIIGGKGGNGNHNAGPGGMGGSLRFLGGLGGDPTAGSPAATGGRGGAIDFTGGTGGISKFNTVSSGAGGDLFLNGGTPGGFAPGVVGPVGASGNIILGNLRGNVGIGTTSPTSLLTVNLNNTSHTTVNGNGSHVLLTNPNASGQNIITSMVGANTVGKWRTDYTGDTYFSTGMTGSTGAFYFLTGGDYGSDGTSIMTISNTGLDVSGSIKQNGVPLSGSQWTTSGANINFNTGYVGIGTTVPTERLHVAGNGKVTGNLVVDGNIAAKYQDMAEWVPSSQKLAAGTVVVLDASQSNHVTASSKVYDTGVAGVVSAQPGVILGEGGEGKVMVATTGRVRVRVDATLAPIRIGDLLVTSDKEGVAMRSQPIDLGGTPIHRPGTLIGKALEPLEKGVGEILVLLSLQ